MDHTHPRTHFSRSGKWQNVSFLSRPQVPATFPSIHPIPSWALPHKLFFMEKPALTSSPEFRCLLQPAPPPAATDTPDTPHTHISPLNSALHVLELNAICHFMHEHHGTLFSFLHSALDLALLNHFSSFFFFFPLQICQLAIHRLLCILDDRREYQRGALDAATGTCRHCENGLNTPVNSH